MNKANSNFPFINRKKEIRDIEKYLTKKPNNVLFVYGPKSTGKSTLLSKVVNNLDPKKYAINYLNLRRVIIYNFKTFLDVFFQETKKEKIRKIISGLTLNAGFFQVSADDEEMLKKMPLRLWKIKLELLKKKGFNR